MRADNSTIYAFDSLLYTRIHPNGVQYWDSAQNWEELYQTVPAGSTTFGAIFTLKPSDYLSAGAHSLIFGMSIEHSNSSPGISPSSLLAVYSDGTTETVSNVYIYDPDGRFYYINVDSFNFKKTVIGFRIFHTAYFSSSDSITFGLMDFTSRKIDASEEKLDNISSGITNLPGKIASSISGFFDNVVGSVASIGKNITNGLTNLGNFIIDGIAGLFVPDEAYFENYFDKLNNFFSEKLGMLYSPIEMFIRLLDAILSANVSNSGIIFPEIVWQGTVIVPRTVVSLHDISTDFNLQQYLYFGTDVLMVGGVILLLQNKLREVLKN